MISVTDLRINNWVKAPLGEWMQVKQLGHKDNPDYIFATGPQGFGTNGFEGIPLSPDILEKCGFAVDKNAGNWNEPEWIIYNCEGFQVGYKESRCCYYRSSDDDFYSTYWPELHHLHQLQNLFYFLVGEELNIKTM